MTFWVNNDSNLNYVPIGCYDGFTVKYYLFLWQLLKCHAIPLHRWRRNRTKFYRFRLRIADGVSIEKKLSSTWLREGSGRKISRKIDQSRQAKLYFDCFCMQMYNSFTILIRSSYQLNVKSNIFFLIEFHRFQSYYSNTAMMTKNNSKYAVEVSKIEIGQEFERCWCLTNTVCSWDFEVQFQSFLSKI